MKHVDGKGGGNPLPMLLTRIRNRLRADSVNLKESVFVAWVGAGDADGVERRLRMEGILGALLRTQVSGLENAFPVEQRLTGAQTIVTGGLNFISPGQSPGDPLRQAATMQSGILGLSTLGQLSQLDNFAVPAAFLAHCLRNTGLTHEHAIVANCQAGLQHDVRRLGQQGRP